MLKMTEICQVSDKPKRVQLFFPVLKKPFWLKTILIYFMLQWRSRKNFITYRLCSELIVISLHRACACSLQAYGPKSLSLQALKNTGVWTTLEDMSIPILNLGSQAPQHIQKQPLGTQLPFKGEESLFHISSNGQFWLIFFVCAPVPKLDNCHLVEV